MADEVATEREYVRIVVPLEREAGDAGPEDEWIWAEPLGAGRFRVESPPFFAYGMSHGDVVRAEGPPDIPRVVDVERKSGHRTMRVALDPDCSPDRSEVRGFLAGVEELGCVVEMLPPKLVAVDVPPEADVGEVVRRLEDARGRGILIWEWADPRPS
jgi:hypothetical protein